MARFAWVYGALAAGVVGAAEPPPDGPGDRPSPGPDAAVVPHAAGYTPPAADGPVAVLVDERIDALLPVLDKDGSRETGQGFREDVDVFAGVEAVRVTPAQVYRGDIPGWQFRVVEKPSKPGEYRYIRFAWKKLGGRGVMIQFHKPDGSNWEHRYVAGENVFGWGAKVLTDEVPADWEVVTSDLFREAGPINVTGIALTPMDGTAALFDHVLFGRTVEDLDRATDVALGRAKPAKPLAGKERDAAWADLLGDDPVQAAAALRAFLATAPDHVGWVRERLPKWEQNVGERVKKLIADLDADDFDTRLKAGEELRTVGRAAVPALKVAANGPSAEARFRAGELLRWFATHPTAAGPEGRAARVVRLLERAGTPTAKEMLDELASGKHGQAYVPAAKLALARGPGRER